MADRALHSRHQTHDKRTLWANDALAHYRIHHDVSLIARARVNAVRHHVYWRCALRDASGAVARCGTHHGISRERRYSRHTIFTKLRGFAGAARRVAAHAARAWHRHIDNRSSSLHMIIFRHLRRLLRGVADAARVRLSINGISRRVAVAYSALASRKRQGACCAWHAAPSAACTHGAARLRIIASARKHAQHLRAPHGIIFAIFHRATFAIRICRSMNYQTRA